MVIAGGMDADAHEEGYTFLAEEPNLSISHPRSILKIIAQSIS